MKNQMKLLIYIIIFLVAILNSGCTSKYKPLPFYNEFIECPRPQKPTFKKIENNFHIGSIEKQQELLIYTNDLEKYSQEQDSSLDCYEYQKKEGKIK